MSPIRGGIFVFLYAGLTALCSTSLSVHAAGPASPVAVDRFGRVVTVKVRLPLSMLNGELKARGARLVADYGTFAVAEIPIDAVPVDSDVEALNQENFILLNAG